MIDKEKDTTKDMNEHIKHRLAFLNEQEIKLKEKLEKGKKKEEEIRKQLIELKQKIERLARTVLSGEEQKKVIEHMEKVLSDAEKKDIQKTFGGKSLPEIQEKIKKEPGKRERMKKKLRIPIVGISVTLAITFAIYEFIQHQKKNKQNQEQVINPGNNSDSTNVILPTRVEANVDSLQAKIDKTHIDNDISYQELANIINNIKKDEIREKLIHYLHQGKIIEAQEMFGMNRDSKYPSNKATGKIDRNTIERFANPYFGLYGKEILDHKDISQDVKDIYQKFLLGEIKNNEVNYLIISKIDFNVYLFSKDHKLIYRQISLLGKDRGKEGERVPYPYYKTNIGYEYHKKKVNTNTPEGSFLVQKTVTLNGNYISDGPLTGIVLLPDTATYETDKFALEIHPIYQPPEDKKSYKNAIESETTTDNTISHGCINVAKDGILKDNLTIGKSVVFITDDKQTKK